MRELHGQSELQAALEDIATRVMERQSDAPLAVVGIYTGGVPLAQRLHRILASRGVQAEIGELDVALYRDDAGLPHLIPAHGTSIPFDVEGKRIVLVDDVAFTGRTARAAIDQLVDFGRPAKIELAVIVDRGHRQLPIQPDYVAFNVETAFEDRIEVELSELGQPDRVVHSSRHKAVE